MILQVARPRASLPACADAIEHLADIAAGRRPKPRAAELELLTERARQVVAMLREAGGDAALRAALEADSWDVGRRG
jgi:hypothetical protein